jgi:hypothetical protein
MKKLYIISLLLSMTAAMSAQQAIRLTDDDNHTQATVQNIQVSRTADRTILTMDFILDELDVPSNRYRAFTPVIRSKDGQKEQRLKTLIVSGRRQNIVFERDGIDALYADNCENIRRQDGQPQSYQYTDAVQAESWHNVSDIFVECDLCGCGDRLKNKEFLITSLEEINPWDLIELANQEPDPGKPMRELHGSAYITFVVDRWEMKPDYMDNRRELRKITDTLDIMVADKNITVNTIKIHGWASPESPYEHNRMLATNRAKSLTEWLRRNYTLPATAFAPAEATPENWIGLREAVVNMDLTTLPHKQDILAIIDDTSLEPDPKEWRIKMRYPEEYRYLLKEIYPGLRRSDYEITFNIRQFNTLDECLEIYRTKPYQLSKHELWRVAQTMPTFSDEYNRVMQQTLLYYPDDEAVNTNLAAVALAQHDLLKAETLLKQAGNGAAAENNRAVVDIIKGNYESAARHLDNAERRGFNVKKNREAIEKLKN